MIFPPGATRQTSVEDVCETIYDAVIVGSGIASSIIANELAREGKSVLILEAGPKGDATFKEYEEYLYRYYSTAAKDNQAPYPANPNAPMPRSSDALPIKPGVPNTSAYIVQNGPLSSDTTYTRVRGGTTMHWEAKVLRMLPEDFRMRTLYGQGQDWPFDFDELLPYYALAEREMGVSGDVDDQEDYLKSSFPKGYVYPMQSLPLSYLDRMIGRGIDGTKVDLYGDSYALKVRSFPQGRNGIPNPLYIDPEDGSKGFVPIGAVSTNQVEIGGRCQGNNNCVPICPVQAKYNANKTLAKAFKQKGSVKLLAQAVASKVHVDKETGRATHIEFKKYDDPKSPEFRTGIARGRIYVLGANAVENPRLMLASGLPGKSELMGRNFMDHAYLLCWALMPMVCGTMRGTNCTGGITALRGGSFRDKQAAFSVDIHNDGWGWAVGSPASDLLEMVDSQYKFGRDLRRDLVDRITRQLQLAFMIEVMPDLNNRISVDPDYTDAIGNMRPVFAFNIPDYTMRGAAYARQFARLVFQRLGAADRTAYDPLDYAYKTYDGVGYSIRGGNHLAGTHIMGSNSTNSVVDADQRSWDHDNLYLVGGGSMPSIGTANVTNTIAALCFRSAKAMLKQLSPSVVLPVAPLQPAGV